MATIIFIIIIIIQIYKIIYLLMLMILWLASTVAGLSITNTFNVSDSSIIDIEMEGDRVYFLTKNAVFDKAPLLYYTISQNKTSPINNTEGSNTLWNGNNLLLVGKSNQLISIDKQTAQLNVRGTIGSNDQINSISSISNEIYGVTSSGKVCRWNLPNVMVFCNLMHAYNATLVDAVSSEKIVTAGKDRNVKIISSSGQSLMNLVLQNEVKSIDHSNRFIAIGDSVGVIKLYDVNKYTSMLTIKGHSGVIGIQVLQMWDMIVAVLEDGNCRVYNQQGVEKDRLNSGSPIASVGWMQNGFVTGHKNGSIKVWTYS